MQAKRFWPPTKYKLLYANFIVYSVIVVLVLCFYHDLIWARKTLRGYLFTGNIAASKDVLLIHEATKSLRAGQDIDSLIPLLEKSHEINPYGNAQLFLGAYYLRQREYAKMLEYYESFRHINPSVISIYTDMFQVLSKKQDRAAIQRLIGDGIKHYQRRVELYQPRQDPSVEKKFNAKAVMIYNKSKEDLELLKKIRSAMRTEK